MTKALKHTLTYGGALRRISHDVQLQSETPFPPWSPPMDPPKAIKKAVRTDNSTDISYMRQQANGSAASTAFNIKDDYNLKDKDTESTPAQAGQHSSPCQ